MAIPIKLPSNAAGDKPPPYEIIEIIIDPITKAVIKNHNTYTRYHHETRNQLELHTLHAA